MRTIDFIKTVRYYMAADSELQSIMSLSAQQLLDRIYYQSAGFSNTIDAGKSTYKYPCISILPDNDGSFPLGVPTNTVKLYIIIYNSVKSDNTIEVLLNISDRLRLLFRDKHEAINSKSRSLTPPVNLKVRDSQWVSGVNYQDKTLGSEQLHKYINTLQLIIGD